MTKRPTQHVAPSGPSAGHASRRAAGDMPRGDADVRIDGAELDVVYHHVEELEADADRITFRPSAREESPFDMTPMVDVTFLLLIFFMVTAAFSLQRALEVPTPRPDQPSTNVQQREPTEEADLITVHVDENNTYRVVTSEMDVEAPSTHELLIRLREVRDAAAAGRKPTRLLVMAHVDALHERVVAAMDAGSQVDMEEIQLMMVQENE